MTDCWFAQFFDTPCDRTWMQRAHVIPQRVLRREHELANPRSPRFDFIPTALTGTSLLELLADPRNWRVGCWAHHQHVDGPWGEYPIPESAYGFARAFDLDHYLPIREAAGCGEHLRSMSGDGLCGFCREERSGGQGL